MTEPWHEHLSIKVQSTTYDYCLLLDHMTHEDVPIGAQTRVDDVLRTGAAWRRV